MAKILKRQQNLVPTTMMDTVAWKAPLTCIYQLT